MNQPSQLGTGQPGVNINVPAITVALERDLGLIARKTLAHEQQIAAISQYLSSLAGGLDELQKHQAETRQAVVTIMRNLEPTQVTQGTSDVAQGPAL